MQFSRLTIQSLKQISGLAFDKAKDYETLANLIREKTSRPMGTTTIKRLFGYINDNRKTNEYTLNTISMFLGYASWSEYMQKASIDSFINYDDNCLYIHKMNIGTMIDIEYLNRKVTFKVIGWKGQKALQVTQVKNGHLVEGDILIVNKISVGKNLEAEELYRGEKLGNYMTNGEISRLEIHNTAGSS